MKRGPISLESLVRVATPSKPTFIPRSQRNKLQPEAPALPSLVTSAIAGQSIDSISADHERERRDRERDREREREREVERARDRERELDKQRALDRERDRDRERTRERQLEMARTKQLAEYSTLDAHELELIKSHYRGEKRKKKRFVKNSEKFKFKFDWDAHEDTSLDTNPIYANRADYQPLFGRGFLAGIDQKVQIARYKSVMDRDPQKSQASLAFERESLDLKLDRLERVNKLDQHWSDKSVNRMTDRDWRIFKEDQNINVRGNDVAHPVRNWDESGLPVELIDAIKRVGYKAPSAIQMQAIPVGLSGRDILGVAETGSGKTAAFVLPMLAYIAKQPPLTLDRIPDGPYAVILAPVRELALQIEAETRKFAGAMGVRTLAIVGGQSIDEQGFALQRGVEVVIATPGRLVDCLKSRYMALNQCNYVVLDEADKMIEMGFESEIRTILEAMPSTNLKSEDEAIAAQQERDSAEGKHVFRHTTMYSATMPQAVENLAKTYLRHPVTIIIGEMGKAVDRITQIVTLVKNDQDKMNKLLGILEQAEPPVIIFVAQKRTAEYLGKSLDRSGYSCARLHSGRSQEQREEAMSGFRNNLYSILVATDVAARGIDVPGITHVIQWDSPNNIQDYTHRIGRTARAGASGMATLFLRGEDTEIMYDLKQLLERCNQRVPQELREHSAATTKPGSAPTNNKRKEQVIFSK
jgi:ATP-dependent RNA helicase DDX23/PRP28